jgi:hypothetical protein
MKKAHKVITKPKEFLDKTPKSKGVTLSIKSVIEFVESTG